MTPIIQRALAFDVRRGPHSIGAHVRDAAAYVCWACARAYEPSLLEDSVQVLPGEGREAAHVCACGCEGEVREKDYAVMTFEG